MSHLVVLLVRGRGDLLCMAIKTEEEGWGHSHTHSPTPTSHIKLGKQQSRGSMVQKKYPNPVVHEALLHTL